MKKEEKQRYNDKNSDVLLTIKSATEDKGFHGRSNESRQLQLPPITKETQQQLIPCDIHSASTSLQVLVVSDVASRVLLDDAVQLDVGQVLDLSLSIASLLLCYHGLLQRQVALGNLEKGQRGRS